MKRQRLVVIFSLLVFVCFPVEASIILVEDIGKTCDAQEKNMISTDEDHDSFNYSEEVCESFCRVSCSIVLDGTTYEASAGNIFTSCGTAGGKMFRKVKRTDTG